MHFLFDETRGTCGPIPCDALFAGARANRRDESRCCGLLRQHAVHQRDRPIDGEVRRNHTDCILRPQACRLVVELPGECSDAGQIGLGIFASRDRMLVVQEIGHAPVRAAELVHAVRLGPAEGAVVELVVSADDAGIKIVKGVVVDARVRRQCLAIDGFQAGENGPIDVVVFFDARRGPVLQLALGARVLAFVQTQAGTQFGIGQHRLLIDVIHERIEFPLGAAGFGGWACCESERR